MKHNLLYQEVQNDYHMDVTNMLQLWIQYFGKIKRTNFIEFQSKILCVLYTAANLLDLLHVTHLYLVAIKMGEISAFIPFCGWWHSREQKGNNLDVQ